LLLFVYNVEAGLGKYCGDWIPLDWKTLPPALPDDRVEVYYLASPLLYCDYLDEAIWINGYHGAVAFLNTRTKQSWNLNYDAWPTFPGALMPDIKRYNNGTVDLVWANNGGVFIYEGINLTYWHTLDTLVAVMTGAQWNSLVALLPIMNKTMPYYNPFTVYETFPDRPLFEGFECFQWTFVCLLEIQKLGATLVNGVTTLQQSLTSLYSHKLPTKMNSSDPAVFAQIVQFYEVLEDGWDDVGVLSFFEELWSVAIEGYFIIYDKTEYYMVELVWPYFELHWYPMKIPILSPNGTEFYHNKHYQVLQ